MAITRRQFVTRLGALAAAAGLGQAEIASISQAFAYGTSGGKTNLGGTLGKPRVIWVHGAECTGCSTSLLSFFEKADGIAIEGTGVTTAAALGLAGALPTELGNDNFTYHALGYNVDGAAVNIADVLVDVIDLQYHETVMGMGGDLAYKFLTDFAADPGGSLTTRPFVLVVEGALQDKHGGGAWNDNSTAAQEVPWCSIAHADSPTGGEMDMPTITRALANKSQCAAVIPIGQCAAFGGYPGCKPPIKQADSGGFDPTMSQTGALGVYDYLVGKGDATAAAKVVNVPGCPTNPWWFCLTVVMTLVDLVGVVGGTGPVLGVLDAGGVPSAAAIDSTRRLKKVYPASVHSMYCPRYRDFAKGIFALKPGQPGCLQKIGCKGPATRSLCGLHGWNGQQRQNNFASNETAYDYGVATVNPAPNGTTQQGGHCTRAGHPCMACTEKGYPDSFVPFVVRS